MDDNHKQLDAANTSHSIIVDGLGSKTFKVKVKHISDDLMHSIAYLAWRLVAHLSRFGSIYGYYLSAC